MNKCLAFANACFYILLGLRLGVFHGQRKDSK